VALQVGAKASRLREPREMVIELGSERFERA
jgi:hypothetical protein